MRKQGTTGTHNGMKSVVASIGSHDIPRLRIGIESRGVSAPGQQDTTSFVLGQFIDEEQVVVKNSLKKAVEAVKILLKEGLDQAMNLYNS